MRDIKFRVWDRNASHFIIPWEGKGYDDVDITFADGKWYITGGEALSDNYVLQQYTGFKDINDKEIYEGDIVEAYDESENETFSGNVIYDQKLASFVFINKCDTYYLTSFDLQVVGNIFQNPESLKNIKYKIVFGKDLKAGDVIIDDCDKAEILEVAKGVGMGSFDFGEYIYIKLVKRRRFFFSKVEKKMTFQKCPMIKLEED